MHFGSSEDCHWQEGLYVSYAQGKGAGNFSKELALCTDAYRHIRSQLELGLVTPVYPGTSHTSLTGFVATNSSSLRIKAW